MLGSGRGGFFFGWGGGVDEGFEDLRLDTTLTPGSAPVSALASYDLGRLAAVGVGVGAKAAAQAWACKSQG